MLQPAEDSGRSYVNSNSLVGDLRTTFSTESPKRFTNDKACSEPYLMLAIFLIFLLLCTSSNDLPWLIGTFVTSIMTLQ